MERMLYSWQTLYQEAAVASLPSRWMKGFSAKLFILCKSHHLTQYFEMEAISWLPLEVSLSSY